jgi:hypothetical protein
MPRFAAILAAALLLPLLPAGDRALWAQTSTPSAGSPPSTGHASVRLVRLLSEVPDELETKTGPLHDVRVQLVGGNVMVFRKGGEFAALLPIERVAGSADSLRYFYYVEKPTVFWLFAGERTRGILTAPAGGNMNFGSFRLVWGDGGGDGDGLGYVYFPETTENVGLRFSVVSGQSVDTADPKETKYWVELGAGEKAGF